MADRQSKQQRPLFRHQPRNKSSLKEDRCRVRQEENVAKLRLDLLTNNPRETERQTEDEIEKQEKDKKEKEARKKTEEKGNITEKERKKEKTDAKQISKIKKQETRQGREERWRNGREEERGEGTQACMADQACGRPVLTTNICTFFVFSEHDFEVESAFTAWTMTM